MDKFKEWISEQQTDATQPAKGHEERFSKRLRATKHRSILRVCATAASVSLLVIAGTWLLSPIHLPYDWSVEELETLSYYEARIELQLIDFKKEQQNQSYCEEFLVQIKELQLENEALRTEVDRSKNIKFLWPQIIQNFALQEHLLDKPVYLSYK